MLHSSHCDIMSLIMELRFQIMHHAFALGLNLRLGADLGHSQLDFAVLIGLGHVELMLQGLCLRLALHLNHLALTLEHELLEGSLHLLHLLVLLRRLLLDLRQLLLRSIVLRADNLGHLIAKRAKLLQLYAESDDLRMLLRRQESHVWQILHQRVTKLAAFFALRLMRGTGTDCYLIA